MRSEVNIFGYELVAREFLYEKGQHSLDFFSRFINENFEWAVSGLWWKEEEILCREPIESVEIIGILEKIVSRYDIKGFYYLNWNDGTDRDAEYNLGCDIFEIIKVANHLYKEVEWVTDMWIFSPENGDCIEVYHEGYITYGKSVSKKA